MLTIQDVLQELEQEAQATRRVLERVRGDQLDWRPHEKSMTLGQLAMHVARIPAAIAELATEDSFDIDTPVPRLGASSTAELLHAFDQSMARAGTLLSGLTDASLTRPWRMVRGGREVASFTRAVLLRSVLLNHWYHHRGQLTVYLRQTGALVPAVYGSSADENPFAG